MLSPKPDWAPTRRVGPGPFISPDTAGRIGLGTTTIVADGTRMMVAYAQHRPDAQASVGGEAKHREETSCHAGDDCGGAAGPGHDVRGPGPVGACNGSE